MTTIVNIEYQKYFRYEPWHVSDMFNNNIYIYLDPEVKLCLFCYETVNEKSNNYKQIICLPDIPLKSLMSRVSVIQSDITFPLTKIIVL